MLTATYPGRLVSDVDGIDLKLQIIVEGDTTCDQTFNIGHRQFTNNKTTDQISMSMPVSCKKWKSVTFTCSGDRT